MLNVSALPDLAAARAGDQAAFARLIEPHRRELLVHCYRMLGSYEDAEDILQETFLRAWRRLETYEERAPFRAWCYKIATRSALDARDRQKVRSLPMHTQPPSDPRDPLPSPNPDLLWKSVDGLNAFFANPTVQEQAGQIFSSRAPAIWLLADGFTAFHLPAPTGRNDRFVGVAQEPVPSHAVAREIHNAVIAANLNAARKRGIVSHDAYVRLAAPGAPEALDLILIDVWASEAGMQEHYGDPVAMQGFHGLFSTQPSSTTWQHPVGFWVEW